MPDRKLLEIAQSWSTGSGGLFALPSNPLECLRQGCLAKDNTLFAVKCLARYILSELQRQKREVISTPLQQDRFLYAIKLFTGLLSILREPEKDFTHEAITYLLAAIDLVQESTERVPLQLQLAAAYLKIDAPDKAAEVYEDILANSLPNISSQEFKDEIIDEIFHNCIALGNKAAALNVDERNIHCFNIALKLHPNSLKLLRLLGDYYFRSQDFSTAFTHYNAAIDQASKRNSQLLPYLQKQAAICHLSSSTNRSELERALELLLAAQAAYKKEAECMGFNDGKYAETTAITNLIKDAERLIGLPEQNVATGKAK